MNLAHRSWRRWSGRWWLLSLAFPALPLLLIVMLYWGDCYKEDVQKVSHNIARFPGQKLLKKAYPSFSSFFLLMITLFGWSCLFFQNSRLPWSLLYSCRQPRGNNQHLSHMSTSATEATYAFTCFLKPECSSESYLKTQVSSSLPPLHQILFSTTNATAHVLQHLSGSLSQSTVCSLCREMVLRWSTRKRKLTRREVLSNIAFCLC